MPAKWHKYSYSAQREERHLLTVIILFVFFLAVLVSLIHTFVFTVYRIDSPVMEPTLSEGNFVATVPLIQSLSAETGILAPFSQPRRGDLVVISSIHSESTNLFKKAVNFCAGFLTLQKVKPFDSPFSLGEKPLIRRIVGMPGDSIYMDGYILYIKPKDSAHFLTEFEVASHDYNINQKTLPEGWTGILPFGDNFPEITLSDNEFFIMCDERNAASDSRVMGPIESDRIERRVVFRYWPFDTIRGL